MIELAKVIIELTGSRSELIHMPLPVDDPKQRRPDITYAREQLGWEPTFGLKQGLLRTITYFEEIVRSNFINGVAPVSNDTIRDDITANYLRADPRRD